MKVLITGAGGFIGRKLIQDMCIGAATEVYAMSRHSVTIEGAKCIQCDVLNDKQLSAVFQENSFDVVIHLAALTTHDEIVNKKLETFDINLRGTINLLNYFNTYCKGGLFLYASTGKVYGKTNEMPILETAMANPQNILGKSKRITEQVIDFYAVPENKYLICRIFNIYGEGQKSSFVVPTIIDQLAQPEIMLGNTSDQRDYLYIDDLSSAIQSCVLNADKFSNIDYVNIGSGEPASVADIIREMEDILGRCLSVRSDKRRFRKDETPVEFCSHEKLSSITGWKPLYSLREGLQKTLKSKGVLN